MGKRERSDTRRDDQNIHHGRRHFGDSPSGRGRGRTHTDSADGHRLRYGSFRRLCRPGRSGVRIIRGAKMKDLAKNTICLWYDGGAEEAARFYAETFPDSSVDAVHKAPGDFPSGKEGDVITVQFTVMGIP